MTMVAERETPCWQCTKTRACRLEWQPSGVGARPRRARGHGDTVARGGANLLGGQSGVYELERVVEGGGDVLARRIEQVEPQVGEAALVVVGAHQAGVHHVRDARRVQRVRVTRDGIRAEEEAGGPALGEGDLGDDAVVHRDHPPLVRWGASRRVGAGTGAARGGAGRGPSAGTEGAARRRRAQTGGHAPATSAG